MKIVAGQFKNHAIHSSKKFEYRPTTSIARKSIFDTLKSLEGKDFLYLYAGSGIVGFEAASRGAKSVTFIELEKKHMNQIIMNAKEIAYSDFNFMVRDANRFLKKSASYDVIFADPPYTDSETNNLVKLCLNRLNKGGVLVLECKSHEFLAGYDKISKFGGTNILYWQR
mgnify:CR=1 FL=1